MDNSGIGDIIKDALSGISDLVDTSTIVGEPIRTDDGTTIIPIVKVSMGVTSGGVERGLKPEKNDKAPLGFAGGGGTGLTMSPVGFLVVKSNGAVELLSLAAANSTSTAVDIIDRVADFVERSPELLRKVASTFGIAKKDKQKSDTDFDCEFKD